MFYNVLKCVFKTLAATSGFAPFNGYFYFAL